MPVMKKKPIKPKRIRYTTATGNSLLRAYAKAAKVFTTDHAVCSTEQDAGFIIVPKSLGEPATGFQVFVKICRYDEALLRRDPLSGGLLVHASPLRKAKRKPSKRDTTGFAGAHL
jgi:hypothetical protein